MASMASAAPEKDALNNIGAIKEHCRPSPEANDERKSIHRTVTLPDCLNSNLAKSVINLIDKLEHVTFTHVEKKI